MVLTTSDVGKTVLKAIYCCHLSELTDCALLALEKAYTHTTVLLVFLKALHFFCPSFEC